MEQENRLGATYLGNGRSHFLVWAPMVQKVELHVLSPEDRLVPLKREDTGYHRAVIENVLPGSLYVYRLNKEKERPDPASRFQPNDVHGPSQVVDQQFKWDDHDWSGLSLKNYVIYELHVGTFSPEGTFNAIIPYLDELKELGVTAIELMPVAQFPGGRNWGYDGVYPFAAQSSYGGPEGLKQMVNACHRKGLAVVLDVVYNHLGPEGNYLGDFAPYFTDRYHTPWGPALNFDGPYSDEVRRFFIENALYWIEEFHIDALRLDAVHAILDYSARTFLEELAAAVQQEAERLRRQVYVVAECNLNNTRLINPREMGGYGLDGQWNDDFHHSLHTLLTGEQAGYYQDFGQLHHLAKAFKEGFVYSGEYAPFWRRRRGTSSSQIDAYRFVVSAQNHDQVGNRMKGERLSQLVSFEGLKLAAGVVLLSPFVPLLFMGEEYGETAPFNYFVSHSDPALIEAVRQGRYEEFASFQWQGKTTDPQDESTFSGSRLNHKLRHRDGHHKVLRDFYRELLRLRKELPALSTLSKETMQVISYEKEKILLVRRWSGEQEVFTVFNFGNSEISQPLSIPSGRWLKLLDSEELKWAGRGTLLSDIILSNGEAEFKLGPLAFALFLNDKQESSEPNET